MRTIISLSFFSITFFISLLTVAQPSKIIYRDRLGDTTQLVNTAIKPPKEKKPKSLRGELSAGLSLNTNGWGIIIDYGRYFGADKFGGMPDKFSHVHTIQLEVGEVKHPKEFRSGGSILGISLQPQSYILGKINNFYRAKIGYGQRRLIAGKPEASTVSIHWANAGGFSLGMAKPYYLNTVTLGQVKYSKDNEQTFTTPGAILGSAGFGKGFDEIIYIPGIYLKSGLHFDVANRRKLVMAIETGVNAEYYFQKIEQMVGEDPKDLFFNFYATIHFGKRS